MIMTVILASRNYLSLPGHIFPDGLHSLFDSTPITIVLVGITISRPTDKEHPYGHASSRRLPL
jgi:hypothetical protein